MVAPLRGGLNSPPIEFALPQPPALNSRYGPYATHDGKISAEGSRILLEFLAKYSHPGKMIRWRWPDLYIYATERYEMEEVDSACIEGAVDAVLLYKPGVAQFATYALFRMRQSLLRELGLTGHPRDRKRPKKIALTPATDVARSSGEPESIEQADQTQFFRSRILASLKIQVCCPKKRAMVAFRHGLNDGQRHDLEVAGAKFGVTKARAQQVEAEILAKIRPELESLRAEL